ncbi:TetR/AcrR family transcriptional regulator [Spongiactinospora sp. TRM90649]|uniref:TetR/AcrR family transcriptional regulator n=1 Tax=Spongiactinospora sp. TRM90649 TaxID=3031114 RepID=UPI0023F6A4CC|nr:TetR/AcrR family transcriptional regulator [Spongiactinospora sp. TRM90649]MDF5758307.1 TetR/AcrR family transcriptional regulator [Spongiactinospora sp. TRM90649]
MPKIVDHDQRRAELADAALDVIARDGIRAVTLRTVAEAAGWSTGVLNHYFKSHNDLLVGALRRAAEIQGRMFRQLRNDLSTDPMQRLRQLVESVLPLDARRVAMTRIFLVFYAEAAASPEAREEVADYLHNWRRVLERVITEAQEAGQLPAHLDPAALAVELVALSDGLAVHAILDGQVLKRLTAGEGIEIELVENSFRLSMT